MWFCCYYLFACVQVVQWQHPQQPHCQSPEELVLWVAAAPALLALTAQAALASPGVPKLQLCRMLLQHAWYVKLYVLAMFPEPDG